MNLNNKMKNLTEAKKALFKELKGVVKTIKLNYSGEGDDGQLDEPAYTLHKNQNRSQEEIGKFVLKSITIDDPYGHGEVDKNSNQWVPKKINPTIDTLVEAICYEELESKYGGWEINDGSFGEFQFNIDKEKIHLSHNRNYCSYYNEEEEEEEEL
jgi:hypothetical protein